MTFEQRILHNIINLIKHANFRIKYCTISLDYSKKLESICVYVNKYIHIILLMLNVNLGNPIECDCTLIPVKRLLHSKLSPDPEWINITCVQLLTSEVSYVSDLSENQLICDIPIDDEDDIFAVTPDVKFRAVKK